MRLIAGLERPDAGEVHVGDRVLTSAEQGIYLPPEKRRMGMVFQSYAIWPHMTVFENIAFPLREQARAHGRAEIRDKVMAMLQSLGLEGLHDRPAPLLSGGQQQRVALGRALVGDPDVLLLDEPFSNLDARRREEMRFELKEVQARVGVTTVFVTHDQSEAMVLSDRVFVMNAGRIVQEGTPRADLRGAALALRHGLPGPGRSRRRAGHDGRRRPPTWRALDGAGERRGSA